MKAADIVTQLALRLPLYTSLFTENTPVTSLSRSGSVVTANCGDAHNLEPGDRVAIVGAVEVIPIGTLTRSGTTGTLVTDTDHDLTNPIAATITISGATEPEFNGTFPRLNVSNRRTITFEMADSGATVATGSPVLEGAESYLRRYDGSYAVLEALTDVGFTFQNSVTSLPDPIGSAIQARAKARVASAADAERALAAYTKQEIDKLWAFVVLEDVLASKSRNVQSDATDNIQKGSEFRQQIIQPFSVFTVTPTSNQISASAARDQAEDVFLAICRSVLSHQFDSNLFVAATQGPTQFVSHGTFRYDSAVYVHAYSFQQTVDLTFDDTVGHSDDVAFRDLDLVIQPDLSEDQPATQGTMTASIDLDDVPL